MSILEKILEDKAQEVQALLRKESLADLKRAAEQRSPLGFRRALCTASFPAVIAEVKRASPSRGVIRADIDPVDVAKDYSRAGAVCLSVLTDEKYFQGSLQYLSDIRKALPSLPLLRKDFLIHPAQIWEARKFGADAVLLIVAALSQEKLEELLLTCDEANLDVLAEVHTTDETEQLLRALSRTLLRDRICPRLILGVNNRNLNDFVVDLKVTEEIQSYLRSANSEKCSSFTSVPIIAESGLSEARDIVRLARVDVRGFLIGEALVSHGSPLENLSMLIHNSRMLISAGL